MGDRAQTEEHRGRNKGKIQKRIREDGQCGFSYNLGTIKGCMGSNEDQGHTLSWASLDVTIVNAVRLMNYIKHFKGKTSTVILNCSTSSKTITMKRQDDNERKMPSALTLRSTQSWREHQQVNTAKSTDFSFHNNGGGAPSWARDPTSTIRTNEAPTSGSSADAGNETTFLPRDGPFQGILCAAEAPGVRQPDPETLFIFRGPPNKIQEPQGSLARVTQCAGLVCPAPSPARSLSAACANLWTSSGVRLQGQGKVPFAVEHGLVRHGDCTSIAWSPCTALPNYRSQQPLLQCTPYRYYEPKGLDEYHVHLE
eukprot:bmy_13133T0